MSLKHYLFHKEYLQQKRNERKINNDDTMKVSYDRSLPYTTLKVLREKETIFGKVDKVLEEVLKKVNDNKRKLSLFFHVHVFQLELLSEMFELSLLKILDDVHKYIQTNDRTSIQTCLVVTFCRSRARCHVSQELKRSFDSFVCLKVRNQGMDIGPKMCCVHYLSQVFLKYTNEFDNSKDNKDNEDNEDNKDNNDNNDNKFIFFFHSKSNPEERTRFLAPYVENFREILEALFNNQRYSMILSDNIMVGDIPGIVREYSDRSLSFEKNAEYSHELLFDLLQRTTQQNVCKNNTDNFHENRNYGFAFPEGSFYGVQLQIAIDIYARNDEHFWKYYNTLNNETSFDLLWFSRNYRKEIESRSKKNSHCVVERSIMSKNDHIEFTIEMFLNMEKEFGTSLYGNNLASRKKIFTMSRDKSVSDNKTALRGISPDGMVEHAFERIPLVYCLITSKDPVYVIRDFNDNHDNNQTSKSTATTRTTPTTTTTQIQKIRSSLQEFLNVEHRKELRSWVLCAEVC